MCDSYHYNYYYNYHYLSNCIVSWSYKWWYTVGWLSYYYHISYYYYSSDNYHISMPTLFLIESWWKKTTLLFPWGSWTKFSNGSRYQDTNCCYNDIQKLQLQSQPYIYICICVYIYMCVSTYINIILYIYIYTHTVNKLYIYILYTHVLSPFLRGQPQFHHDLRKVMFQLAPWVHFLDI